MIGASKCITHIWNHFGMATFGLKFIIYFINLKQLFELVGITFWWLFVQIIKTKNHFINTCKNLIFNSFTKLDAIVSISTTPVFSFKWLVYHAFFSSFIILGYISKGNSSIATKYVVSNFSLVSLMSFFSIIQNASTTLYCPALLRASSLICIHCKISRLLSFKCRYTIWCVHWLVHVLMQNYVGILYWHLLLRLIMSE